MITASSLAVLFPVYQHIDIPLFLLTRHYNFQIFHHNFPLC